jgi:hypothetical protein
MSMISSLGRLVALRWRDLLMWALLGQAQLLVFGWPPEWRMVAIGSIAGVYIGFLFQVNWLLRTGVDKNKGHREMVPIASPREWDIVCLLLGVVTGLVSGAILGATPLGYLLSVSVFALLGIARPIIHKVIP